MGGRGLSHGAAGSCDKDSRERRAARTGTHRTDRSTPRSERDDSCDTVRPVQTRGGFEQGSGSAANGIEIQGEATRPRSAAHVSNPYPMKPLLDLPYPQKRAVDLIKEVAAEKECRPYLVGGPVRDLLLGRHAIDIDLTLEEGASTLARALAKRVDGRVRSFPQFLTYKVTAQGLPDIDIATARKERYRQPGALPAVTAGRLKDDLLRRDFTINAVALGLLDGKTHDPAHGARDIHDRVVRVLHERSFLDDPTRIFRAVRLATRLGFRIDPDTAKW